MSTVRVRLIDGSTGQPLGEADLPAEQLPESFAAPTTLHIEGDDWQVESADPITRAEYVASGELRIVLRKLEHVDPKKLLFSLPTLENVLPPVVAGDAEHALVLHEDDWRQHELIASRFEPEIVAELAQIRAVFESRKGVGFQRLHVRELIPDPLHGITLALADVQNALGEVVRRNVSFGGHAGIVAGGFAFVHDGGQIYGREEDGFVRVLAIANGDAARLGRLVNDHGLVEVDWCRARSGTARARA